MYFNKNKLEVKSTKLDVKRMVGKHSGDVGGIYTTKISIKKKKEEL